MRKRIILHVRGLQLLILIYMEVRPLIEHGIFKDDKWLNVTTNIKVTNSGENKNEQYSLAGIPSF